MFFDRNSSGDHRSNERRSRGERDARHVAPRIDDRDFLEDDHEPVLVQLRQTVTRVTLDGEPVTLKSIQSSISNVVAVHPLGTCSLNPTPDSVGALPPPTIETDGMASWALRTSMTILPA